MRNSLNTVSAVVFAAALLFTAALLFSACGNDETETAADPGEPPPLQLTRGDNSISLNAWTYCWTSAGSDVGICSDGAPPEKPAILAGEGPIALVFPADFNFLATVYDAAYKNEIGSASVVTTDDGWQISPKVDGPAVLEIFGNGPEGDVIISVAIG